MIQSEQKHVSYTVKGLKIAIANDAKIKTLRKERVPYKLGNWLSNDKQEITKSKQKCNDKNEI